jgi:hypothetical protein
VPLIVTVLNTLKFVKAFSRAVFSAEIAFSRAVFSAEIAYSLAIVSV